jgi:hypothetical protein
MTRNSRRLSPALAPGRSSSASPRTSSSFRQTEMAHLGSLKGDARAHVWTFFDFEIPCVS